MAKGRAFFDYPEAKIVRDPSAEERAAMEYARRRVLGMLRLWGILQSADSNDAIGLPDLLGLLGSCYLQGVRDAVAVIDAKGWPPGRSE